MSMRARLDEIVRKGRTLFVSEPDLTSTDGEDGTQVWLTLIWLENAAGLLVDQGVLGKYRRHGQVWTPTDLALQLQQWPLSGIEAGKRKTKNNQRQLLFSTENSKSSCSENSSVYGEVKDFEKQNGQDSVKVKSVFGNYIPLNKQKSKKKKKKVNRRANKRHNDGDCRKDSAANLDVSVSSEATTEGLHTSGHNHVHVRV